MTRGTLTAPNPLPNDWKGILWVGLIMAAARRREKELIKQGFLTTSIMTKPEYRTGVLLDYIGVLNYAVYTPEIVKMIQANKTYANLERKYGKPVSHPEVQAKAERQAAKLRERHARARRRARGK